MAKLIKILPLLLVTIPSVTSAQSSACATGTAVADPANNPGLVADCDTLLSVLDTLAGTPTLNWSASLPIDNWDGVSVAGRPARVSQLSLPAKNFTGTIPSDLARLSYMYPCTVSCSRI